MYIQRYLYFSFVLFFNKSNNTLILYNIPLGCNCTLLSILSTTYSFVYLLQQTDYQYNRANTLRLCQQQWDTQVIYSI